LLPAANLLQLQEIKEACCEFLQTQLHHTNCLGINELADLYSCMELLKSSELYTQQNFSYEILFTIRIKGKGYKTIVFIIIVFWFLEKWLKETNSYPYHLNKSLS